MPPRPRTPSPRRSDRRSRSPGERQSMKRHDDTSDRPQEFIPIFMLPRSPICLIFHSNSEPHGTTPLHLAIFRLAETSEEESRGFTPPQPIQTGRSKSEQSLRDSQALSISAQRKTIIITPPQPIQTDRSKCPQSLGESQALSISA